MWVWIGTRWVNDRIILFLLQHKNQNIKNTLDLKVHKWSKWLLLSLRTFTETLAHTGIPQTLRTWKSTSQQWEWWHSSPSSCFSALVKSELWASDQAEGMWRIQWYESSPCCSGTACCLTGIPPCYWSLLLQDDYSCGSRPRAPLHRGLLT